MRKELSDRFLKSLAPPEAGRIEVSDTKRQGLRFRLSSSGRASWLYEKRVKGGEKRKHTLGAWPKPVSLSQARAMALEIEAEAARGFDRVAHEKERRILAEADTARAKTLLEVIDVYDELNLSKLRRGKERRHQIVMAMQAHLSYRIDHLTRSDIQKAVDDKARQGRLIFANRIRAALVAFTKWATDRDYLPADIGIGVSKAVKEKHREHCPTLSEIRAIWAATYQMGPLWGPALRLLALTGQRRGEIFGLMWDEVQIDRARIVKPGERTKNGKEHITHLSQPAMTEVQELASRVEGKPQGLVFTTTGHTPVSGVSKAKLRLDKILGESVRPWRIHDIRTAMATYMADNGISESVADRILNHSAVGSAPSAVARIYNTSSRLDDRAHALDFWASEVVKGGVDSNVIPLGAAH